MARDRWVRVEVEDDGGPWEPAGGHPEQNGRRVAIVSALASRCGRDRDDTRRTVWFELEPAYCTVQANETAPECP